MNRAILLVGLLAGTPSGGRPGAPDARMLARFRADPSGFSPHFGKSDPGAHVARFGGHSPSNPPPSARDAGLKDVLHKPRMNTSLQFSVQWKGL